MTASENSGEEEGGGDGEEEGGGAEERGDTEAVGVETNLEVEQELGKEWGHADLPTTVHGNNPVGRGTETLVVWQNVKFLKMNTAHCFPPHILDQLFFVPQVVNVSVTD
jgi:hypothetical protein